MGMPQEDGRYLATIIENSLSESGQKNLATFVARYELGAKWEGGEWVEQGPTDPVEHINGYHYLEKNNGELNTYTIDALKDALPLWNGDIAALDEPIRCRVMVRLAWDTYNGTRKLRVENIDPENADPAAFGGGGIKRDPAKAKSIATRLSSRMRALGTPVAQAKPAGAPSTPPTSAPAAAPPVATPAAAPAEATAAEPATLGSCWKDHASLEGKAGKSQDEIEQSWHTKLAEMFPGKNYDDYTAEDWLAVSETIIPF